MGGSEACGRVLKEGGEEKGLLAGWIHGHAFHPPMHVRRHADKGRRWGRKKGGSMYVDDPTACSHGKHDSAHPVRARHGTLQPPQVHAQTHVSIAWICCFMSIGCPSSPIPCFALSTMMSCASIALATTRLLGSCSSPAHGNWTGAAHLRQED